MPTAYISLQLIWPPHITTRVMTWSACLFTLYIPCVTRVCLCFVSCLQLIVVRNAAPSATVAPFPGSFSAGSSSGQQPAGAAAPAQPGAPDQAHAAPPPGLDPHWTQAAAEEGVVAYKNLLGPGQNMSHVPGADVEAQEINTVADMVNFEVKKKMYKRFSTGFGIFMIAQLCK